MRNSIHFTAALVLILAGACPSARAQSASYVHFIRQVQYPGGAQWDTWVTEQGESRSSLPIGNAGSKFELWSVNGETITAHLLDSTIVAAYMPLVTVTIRTEDPYSGLPRTRADRPFYVDVYTGGIRSEPDAPNSSKSVTLIQNVQSYGASGDGSNLDRTQSTLLSQASITSNGQQVIAYALTSVPGTDRRKARGEERFSVFSVEDYLIPSSQIDSKTIQIWPVADGTITGITEGQIIGGTAPPVTFTMNDLYPSSTSYARVYKGGPQQGASGAIVPGSAVVISNVAPSNRVLVAANYDSLLGSDGQWTMELLTETPFGTDRLAAVSFIVQGHGDFQSKLMVTGTGAMITDDDSTPIVEDSTDFGLPPAGGNTVARTFMIQNTSNAPLNLSGVTMSGLNASDFTVISGPASQIAVGESSTFEIRFSPSAALLRSAVVNIEIGSPIENTFNFAVQGGGSTIESWRQFYFGTIDNTGDAANLGDFDQDGILNLVEFAFGLDPRKNSTDLLPKPQSEEGYQVIRFTQPSGITGLTYGAEWSTSLLPDSWIPMVDSAVPPLHSFIVPSANQPKLYMRLKVTSP